MHVDQATVRRIARLARIKIEPEEETALEQELSSILDWVEQLNALETDTVEPTTRIVPMDMKKRDDVVTEGDQADAVTQNAPMSEDGFFVVPKIVE